jgi:hypothetical protein
MHPRSRLTKRQSRSFARQQRDRLAWKIGLIVVALLSWLFVFSRLSWLGVFSIANVEVYGADPDISVGIRTAAIDALQGSYLGLFSRSDTVIYPKRAVISAVTAASPRIEKVDVRRAGLHGIAITVTEKTPAAIICSELPDFSSETASAGDEPATAHSGCYFADDSGLIFREAPAFSGQVYRRYFEPSLADSASSTSIVGSYATSSETFSALQAFYTGLHQNGIEARGILMKDGGEYELYAVNPSPRGASSSSESTDIAVIYFNQSRPLDDELSNLVSFWAKEENGARAKGGAVRFDSIDVRYGSNVFYRLEK